MLHQRRGGTGGDDAEQALQAHTRAFRKGWWWDGEDMQG